VETLQWKMAMLAKGRSRCLHSRQGMRRSTPTLSVRGGCVTYPYAAVPIWSVADGACGGRVGETDRDQHN